MPTEGSAVPPITVATPAAVKSIGTPLGAAPDAPSAVVPQGVSTLTPPATPQPQPKLPEWAQPHKGWADDDAAYLENKKFDPVGLLKSYRELERLSGDPKSLARIPKPDDAKGWEEFWAKIGRPDSPEGYELAVPDGGDPEMAKGVQELAHKLGLNKKQLHELVGWHNSQADRVAKLENDALEAKIASDTEALKKKFGLAFDQKVAVAKKAAERFKLDHDWQVKFQKTFGPAALVEHLVALGEGFGEHEFVGGETTAASTKTPAAAQQAIDQMMTAEFKRRLVSNQLTAEEKATLDNLYKQAYPNG